MPDDRACLRLIRELLSYLPGNNVDEAPRMETTDPVDREDEALDRLVPASPNQPYDMLDLIHAIADEGAFLEVHRHFAKNIIVGFARLGGRSVGIVANQPAHLAGTLDIDASVKAARFVRFCDAFNIPLVTFEDVPGFLPGTVQEFGGIIRHGAKLLYAFAEATVPKVTRDHAQGLRRRLLRDVEQAHPHRRELRLAGRRDRGDGARRGRQHPLQARDRQGGRSASPPAPSAIAEFREKFANPYVAAARGFIDEVIHPRQTRAKLIAALAGLETKRDKQPAEEARQHSALTVVCSLQVAVCSLRSGD